MQNLLELFLKNTHCDKDYCFRKCKPSDEVLEKFTPEDWHRIVSWIRSQEELTKFSQELPYSMATLVYVSKQYSMPLCFIMLLRDHPRDHNTVSFHGGGWHSSFVNFHCGWDLLKTLSACGFKIRTSIKKDNKKAQRFVEAIGMHKTTRKGDIYWYRYLKG